MFFNVDPSDAALSIMEWNKASEKLVDDGGSFCACVGVVH
jgi:hypothetical protein